MSAQVEFFFDCSSPWTYLGFEALLAAEKDDGFSIRWRPFLVGGVFNTVNPSVYEMRTRPVVPKARYFAKDLHDWIRRSGLAIKWTPSVFPVNSARAMRLCLMAADAGVCEPVARRIFELYWGEDRDISQADVLAEAAAANGLDVESADAPEWKAQLRANTDELIARGGFGSPTYFLGDDMYFGQDRLVLVREAAARLA